MLIEEHVYLGRDNIIALELDIDKAAIVHTTVTRCQLYVGKAATVVDSNVNPTWFNFTIANEITIKLGASSLPVGRHQTKVVIFDSANPLGIVWGFISLTVE